MTACGIEDFSAFIHRFQRVFDGGALIQEFSTVGKRVRRDVDNAHDERRSRERKLKLSRTENHAPQFKQSLEKWKLCGSGECAADRISCRGDDRPACPREPVWSFHFPTFLSTLLYRSWHCRSAGD